MIRNWKRRQSQGKPLALIQKAINFNFRSYESFEAALTTIYEDTILDMVKQIFLNLRSQNIIIPWMFMVYTKSDDLNLETESLFDVNDKKKYKCGKNFPNFNVDANLSL